MAAAELIAGSPRTRGDGPCSGKLPVAGSNSSPRTRGDGPQFPQAQLISIERSPRTRGDGPYLRQQLDRFGLVLPAHVGMAR